MEFKDEVWTHDLEEIMFSDEVNKPAHYTKDTIECIEYLEDNLSTERYKGFLEGNAKKYLHRFRYKGKLVQDLRKAQWYLARLVESEESLLSTEPNEEGDQFVIEYLLTDLKAMRDSHSTDAESTRIEEAFVTLLKDWYMTEEQFDAENL